MTTNAKVQTIGPADPNAPVRVKFYAGISAVLGVVGVLATFNVITADQAVNIKDFAESAMNLAGSFGLGYAALKTRKQVGNGTFDEAPDPESNPVLDAFEAVDAIKTRVDQAVTESTAKVNEGIAVIQGAVKAIPGGWAEGVADLVESLKPR